MRKTTSLWKISELAGRINRIDFPEYQREPTIWTRVLKQRLIDSILRDFDIAAIYLYRHGDGHWDCVDGRQRISAIRSFLGQNPADELDKGFPYRVMNEIYTDEKHPFTSLDDKSYAEICNLAAEDNEAARSFKKQLKDYEVTVVELSGSKLPQEFNLQFTRLNLGQLINSGEKLNAMIGELRDRCFGKLAGHKFLAGIDIPTRRYATQQLAAQIVAQVFAIEESSREREHRAFARIRHTDLQRLFKLHAELGAEESQWIERAENVMDHLAEQLDNLPILRSRAIVLSIVLLAYANGLDNEQDAQQMAKFASTFIGRLRWQVGLGLDVDDEYRYLIDFQRHLTQASAEKYSVRRRAVELERSFEHWRKEEILIGDKEYRDRTGAEPKEH